MDCQKVVVLVEDTTEARTALQWAVSNFIRSGDSITLLHVYPTTRSSRRQKSLRLEGFQLALSFKDLCTGIAEAKVEILVKEGDVATNVVTLVNRISASTLVVGLHDHSFIYSISSLDMVANIKCRILAVNKELRTSKQFVHAQLSHIQIMTLRMPEPKIPYPFLHCPIWKRPRRRRKRGRRREN